MFSMEDVLKDPPLRVQRCRLSASINSGFAQLLLHPASETYKRRLFLKGKVSSIAEINNIENRACAH